MRILYHHRTMGDGAEGIHVAEMVRAFRALGHEVRVVSPVAERTKETFGATRRWSLLRRLTPAAAYEAAELAYNLYDLKQVGRAVRELQPDLVYDRFANYSFAAVRVARAHGIPVLVEVNSPYSYQKRTFDERLSFARLSRAIETRTCRAASRVIVVSTPLKRILASFGVPEERIVVMPNGADPEVFHPDLDGGPVRERLGLQGRIVVGFTGILRAWHGLDLLVDAFGRVGRGRDDLHLLIVGDGPIRAELEARIRAAGLEDRVTISGRVPHDQVRDWVAAMDVTVSPRATAYASPMKVLEYMAMGRAVVAPAMDNLRDILADGEEGLLFVPEDPEALAGALERVIGDGALRERLGKAARRKVETERTWAHNARAVVRLVEALAR